EALLESDRLATEARATSDLSKWGLSIAAARRAQGLLNSSRSPKALLEQVEDRLTSLLNQERDRRMVLDLDEARILRATWVGNREERQAGLVAFRRAFKNYGIDIETASVQQTAAEVRSSPIREVLVAAIEDWAIATTETSRPPPALWEVARAVDTDPIRD